jgi:hypothetical protein
MRTAVLLLFLAAPLAPAAPAPFPKPKPKPPANPYWQIDFSPLQNAGMVNIQLRVVIRAADGDSRQVSISQVGTVAIAPIIDGVRSHAAKDSSLDPSKTRLAIKSVNGKPVASVKLTFTGADPKFSPVVVPAGKKK